MKNKFKLLIYSLPPFLLFLLVLVSGCGGNSVTNNASTNRSLPALFGTQEWDKYDAFEFRTQKLYKRDFNSPITAGDIYLVPAECNPPGSECVPELSTYIEKINALAIYNAGNNETIDCREVSYDQKVSRIEILPFELLKNYKIPIICTHTQDDNFAKIIFHDRDIFSFDWTYTKIPKDSEADILKELERTCEANLLIYLVDDSGLEIKPDYPREKMDELHKKRKEYFKPRIDAILTTLSKEEFTVGYISEASGSFFGKATREGYQKLLENPDVGKIYWNRPGYPTME